MTKKDYELIAGALAGAMGADIDSDVIARDYRFGVKEAARRIARVLANDNPRFDQDRFNQACGIGGVE